MKQVETYLSGNIGLIIKVSGILALVLCSAFLIKFVIRRIHARLDKKCQGIIHESFNYSFYRPLMTLIWVIGVFYIILLVSHFFGVLADARQIVPKIKEIGVVLCLMWFFFVMKKQFGIAYNRSSQSGGKKIDTAQADIISKLGTIIILVVTGVFLLQVLGVSLGTVVAFGGFGGIAFGFASKDVLGNFLSGIMIYITRPFKVGDWIYSPDKQLEGTVEEIGYYMTQIRSFEKRPIYVPNSLFSKIVITNASRMTNRRIYHNVGVRYADFNAISKIAVDIKKMLQEHKEIDQGQTMLVNFNKFNESSLDIMIYTFTKTVVWAKWLDIQQDVLLKIGKIVASHEAQIAFPTRTLDMPAGQEAASLK